MSIACLVVTHIPIKTEQLRTPTLRGQAALIYRRSGTEKTVIDRSPLARDTAVGMPLEQALASCPNATIIEADEPSYRQLWKKMLEALEQRSPIIENAELGIAYVDLRGLERLYKSEEGIVTALLDAIPQSYRPRIGVAAGKFPAYIAALHASANSAFHVPEDVKAFLAPIPVFRLPSTWKTKKRLMDFGVNTIGQVAQLPFDAIQGEFGKEGARLSELANGHDTTSLFPQQKTESFAFETTFSAPTTSLSVVLTALEILLGRAFRIHLQGRFARIFALSGQVTSRPPWSTRIAFRHPVGTHAQAYRIIRDRLLNLVLPGPLETLTLTLTDITGEFGRQENLLWNTRRHSQFNEAMRNLQIRLGYMPPIYHIRNLEPWSRIPERRHALVAYEVDPS